jgi:hypothetical protein
MPNSMRETCASDRDTFMFEHVDRRGRIRILPLMLADKPVFNQGAPVRAWMLGY